MEVLGYITGTPKVSLEVIEPTTVSAVQMFRQAQNLGYLTSAQVKTQHIKEVQTRQAREQRRDIERRNFERGDRVCSYKSPYPRIIDEVTNKGIKVSLRIGNTNHWYNKSDWYLCEN
jgi:hypothetical protein